MAEAPKAATVPSAESAGIGPGHHCLGTMYIQTRGATLGVANGCFCVSREARQLLCPPRHEVRRIVLIGRIHVTQAAIELAGRLGIPIAFLTRGGDFLGLFSGLGAAVAIGTTGERSLAARRHQWTMALEPPPPGQEPESAASFARRFAIAKLENSRALLLRAGRREEGIEEEDAAARRDAAVETITRSIAGASTAPTIAALLGHEGTGARAFFGVLQYLIAPRRRGDFAFSRRTRRPPRDPFNALLSFLYALLATECTGAVRAAGLEASLGFLHAPRQGRPALALDLMEELRAPMVDRLALALVNRGQLGPEHFHNPEPEELGLRSGEEDPLEIEEGGIIAHDDMPPPVHLNEAGRLTVLAAWRSRQGDMVHHPAAGRPVPWRLVPHLQAAALVQALADGDPGAYQPFRPRL